MFKVAFLGRGRLGLRVLTGLLNNQNIQVPVIITCRPTPEVASEASSFEQLAQARGIDFYQTNNINGPEWVKILRNHRADMAVALLWLHTIKAEVIDTAKLGFINFHGGLLPKYRGNACGNWAILNGESEIGATVHFMAPGDLDSGPIIKQEKIPISDSTSIGCLTEQCEEVGVRLVLDAVESLRTGHVRQVEQHDLEASYCYPRLPRDGEIDWSKSAGDIERLVRATGRPYPGAYSYFSDVWDKNRIKKLSVWAAHVEEHPLPEFYAVPGHLLKLNKGHKWGAVCGDKRLLILDEISVDGVAVAPERFFKTVRQRLGLDVQTHIAHLEERLLRCEAILSPPDRHLSALAAQFLMLGSGRLDELIAATIGCIDDAAGRLRGEGLPVAVNPLRNYSFQRRFFDWEQRERWFGIQVYQSFRLGWIEGEPIAIGLWHFSDVGSDLQQRIYVSIKPEYVLDYGAACRSAFESLFNDYPKVAFPANTNACSALYADVSGMPAGDLITKMVGLAKTFRCTAQSEN